METPHYMEKWLRAEREKAVLRIAEIDRQLAKIALERTEE